MPKDYRERRIDNKPPRVVTRRTAGAATRTDPLTDEGGGFVVTDITPEGTYALQPGDGILWFLRLATTDTSPSGRLTSITTVDDDPVSFNYATLPGGWAGYVWSFYGISEFDSLGIDLVIDDTIYVIWDQYIDFTAGDYKIHFDLPAGTRVNVERAIRLRGIDPSDPGDFYQGQFQSPQWNSYYGDPSDSNTFPALVPLPAVAALVYGIWETSGSVNYPAGYNSVDGLTLLTYTMYDPTAGPSIKRSMVSSLGTPVIGATTSVAAPWENGNGGDHTDYWLNALVFNADPSTGGLPVEY